MMKGWSQLTGPVCESSGPSAKELKTGPPGPPPLVVPACVSWYAGHADFTSPMYCSFASSAGKSPKSFHATLTGKQRGMGIIFHLEAHLDSCAM